MYLDDSDKCTVKMGIADRRHEKGHVLNKRLRLLGRYIIDSTLSFTRRNLAPVDCRGR